MKTLAVALLLLQPIAVLASADKPNPADFPIKIHVISSSSQALNNVSYVQVLETTIDGQPTELTGNGGGVLAPGDYSARLNPDVQGPGDAMSYDVYRGYYLLLPDGKTRKYKVTGLGLPSTNP